MTVFSTFILAPALGEAGIIDPTTAALVCPIAMQWVSAPVHLLGLDMYNRPGEGAGSRARFIGSEYLRRAYLRRASIYGRRSPGTPEYFPLSRSAQ